MENWNAIWSENTTIRLAALEQSRIYANCVTHAQNTQTAKLHIVGFKAHTPQWQLVSCVTRVFLFQIRFESFACRRASRQKTNSKEWCALFKAKYFHRQRCRVCATAFWVNGSPAANVRLSPPKSPFLKWLCRNTDIGRWSSMTRLPLNANATVCTSYGTRWGDYVKR